MKYRITVSEKANALIKRHIAFIANVSKSAARKQLKEFETSLKKLEDQPERYPFFEAPYIPADKYHKLIIDSRYLFLYIIKDNEVSIEYVLDCRQDYSWLIK